jgi:phosphoglycerate dehydrogenase-like enzyme
MVNETGSQTKDRQPIRIAILDDIHQAYAATPGVRQLRERAEVYIFTQPFGSPAALRGFEALVANRERTHFTRHLLEQLPGLRILVQTGTHAGHIDLEAAAERNIIVAKAAGGFSTGAGELAFGLMLALMRQIPSIDAAVRAGTWPTPMTRVLHGKTLGIVGLGNIGRYVARIARAFEMLVFAWSPQLSAATAAACGVQRLELDELLRRSDVVSIHAALNPQSRGLIDARRLALMQPTAVLINTARGPVVDEAALCQVLAERRIAGAGLDVFAQEPLPPSHALTKLPNVVLTSHIGWPTDERYAQFAEAAATALIAYLDGREVPRFLSS